VPGLRDSPATRWRSRRLCIQHLAPRRGLQDCLHCFTPPQILCTLDAFPSDQGKFRVSTPPVPSRRRQRHQPQALKATNDDTTPSDTMLSAWPLKIRFLQFLATLPHLHTHLHFRTHPCSLVFPRSPGPRSCTSPLSHAVSAWLPCLSQAIPVRFSYPLVPRSILDTLLTIYCMYLQLLQLWTTE